MNRTKAPSPPAVDRALSILEAIAHSRRGLTFPEVCELTGVPRSSAHCLLVALERRGYLQRNQMRGRYLFGTKIFNLANMAVSGTVLREAAGPFLRDLVGRTGLTAHMAILEQDQAVLIEQVAPVGSSKLSTWLGKRLEVHCTALGKALVAYLPHESLERIVCERGLQRHNENTIGTARALAEELALTRTRGYALDDEEDQLGTRCIAAPVFGPEGDAIAAVSQMGTTAQITVENGPEITALLKETGARISEALRFQPSQGDLAQVHAAKTEVRTLAEPPRRREENAEETPFDSNCSGDSVCNP